MSGVQPPQALFDLYRDLRDRRLLPLVVVLVAAMAVVPIVLSSSPQAAPTAPAPAAVPVADKSAPAEPVVLTDPGVRDYRRRLSGEGSTDPFVQRFTAPPPGIVDALEAATASVPGDVASTTAGATTAPADPGAVTPSSGGGGSTVVTQVKTDTKVVFYRLKVKAGEVGGEMKVSDEVGASTALPSKVTPALLFLGANFNSELEAQRAYFLVSNGVSAISGDGRCELGDPCQLLSLEPGQHADLAWTDGLVYRVTLLAFRRHVRDQVPAGQFGTGGSGSAGGGSAGRSG